MRQLSLFDSPRPSPGQPAARAPRPVIHAPAPAPLVSGRALPESAAELSSQLARLLDEPVEVELTDNGWTMVSYRRAQGVLKFRLHHMFLCAGEGVLRALAGFTGAQKRRAHGRAIDQFVRAHRHLIRATEPRPQPALPSRGRVHDLAELFAALNAQQFDGRIHARIGWGRRPPGRPRRSIKMGVYFHEQKLIRIHPALDDERVPRHFVEMVVFHEMLHQLFPPRAGEDGRRCVHGPDFRRAERAFPGYERARAWERAHLHVLLRD